MLQLGRLHKSLFPLPHLIVSQNKALTNTDPSPNLRTTRWAGDRRIGLTWLSGLRETMLRSAPGLAWSMRHWVTASVLSLNCTEAAMLPFPLWKCCHGVYNRKKIQNGLNTHWNIMIYSGYERYVRLGNVDDVLWKFWIENFMIPTWFFFFQLSRIFQIICNK